MIDFKKLRVWEVSHQLTLQVYKLTSTFPGEEKYGLVQQMRRSASSVPTNIAEGCGRGSDAELVRFLVISMGSASELEYQILLAKDLHYLAGENYEEINKKNLNLTKMLNVFIQSQTKTIQT